MASFAFQSLFQIPENPRNQVPFRMALLPETSLPFEDSHAFGSIAVAMFGFYAVAWAGAPRRLHPSVGLAACFLYLTLASWSRAAWMVAILLLLFTAARTLPLRWCAAFAAATAAALWAFSVAWKDAWAFEHPLVSRLGTLLHVDQPRMFLYHKAAGMLAARPLTGFGIGSCDRTSMQFASADDPLGRVPGFAHNFLLQIAVEQGLVVSALYAVLIAWVLASGMRAGGGRARTRTARERGAFGAAVALAAYLVTQMTANSLNVYGSNQFFFWFLMAAVASWALCPREPDESAPA